MSLLNQSSIFATLAEACTAAGVSFPVKSTSPGRWSYTSVEGKKSGNGAGRVKVFSDGKGGIVWNWVTGEKVIWFDDWGKKVSPEEFRRRSEELKAHLLKAQKEERRQHTAAARLARFIFEKANGVGFAVLADHPYINRKRVTPVRPMGVIPAAEIQEIFNRAYPKIEPDRYPANPVRLWDFKAGAPMVGDVLVIPLFSIDSGLKLQSLELISENGGKYALPGAMAAGAFWLPSMPPTMPQRVGIAEGVATALSISEVKGFPVAAARSCGNLKATARALRRLFPLSRLVVYGDVGNGSQFAKEAADEVGAGIVFPAFTDELRAMFQARTGGESPTDFNDFYIATGEI